MNISSLELHTNKFVLFHFCYRLFHLRFGDDAKFDCVYALDIKKTFDDLELMDRENTMSTKRKYEDEQTSNSITTVTNS